MASALPPRLRTRRRPGYRALVVASVALGAVAGGSLSARGAATQTGSAPKRASAITVTSSRCAPQWGPRRTGTLHFSVTNRGRQDEDVQLLDPSNDRVFAEVATLAPATTVPLTVTLSAGHYAWQCASIDNVIVTSNLAPVTGPKVRPTPSYVPVTPDEFQPAVSLYQTSIEQGLSTLATATDQLLADVRAGEVGTAKRQWLVAHLDYARLGAAYDTFGDFNDRIDGRADGLPGGVDDTSWAGFLRLEHGLWHNQPTAMLVGVTTKLDAAVHGLKADFPHQLFIDTDLPLRAHEILENTLQFELTGDTDEGSHTNLATAWANAQGTATVMSAISDLLGAHDPSLLTTVDGQLTSLTSLFASYRRAGTWVPLDALTIDQREQLDAAMDRLLTNTALIPGQLRLFAVGQD